MTIFEDLIVELKNENLLEETVLDVSDKTIIKNDGLMEMAAEEQTEEAFVQPLDVNDPMFEQLSEMEKPVNRREFYRKRAVDEMNSLQMVEHVFSAIEREHMKSAPITFNDLEAKKALNKFLQISEDLESEEHAQAELGLMRETETWSTALAARDAEISISNLRRFCENSRPPLSSQALLSLARYYRNSQFSESTRAKFEFIMTRLFAREGDFQKRSIIFEYEEMVGHIKTFYGDWSSVSLYAQNDDDTDIKYAIKRFSDIATEAETFEFFDDVLAAGFFDKVRDFKEETREMFFAPTVTAAAIICNAQIGNKFVDLVQKERLKTSPKLTAEKYGSKHDAIVSDAAGKTVNLVEVLRSSDIDFDAIEDPIEITEYEPDFTFGNVAESAKSWFKFDLYAVNRWMVVLTVLVVIGSIGMYIWSEQKVESNNGVLKAATVSVDDAKLNEYIKAARSTKETFYGVMQPTWDKLDEKAQQEFLQNAWTFAKNKGFRRVQLLNDKGKTVGYAAEGKSSVTRP